MLYSLSVLAMAACAYAQFHYPYNPYSVYGYYSSLNQMYGAAARPYQYPQTTEQVDLHVYYESLCPDSIKLYIEELCPVVRKLGSQLRLTTYPYGKATTTVNGNNITFECQHGERECYGNKLHVCAIDELSNSGAWLDFNSCLLSSNSNDAAVDNCGQYLSVTSNPIKQCARSGRGDMLLKHYGDLSSMVTYDYIPHVVINGKPMPKRANLFRALCAEFNNPPESCRYAY